MAGKAAVIISMLLIGLACACCVVCIMSPEWFVASAETAKTGGSTRVTSKWSVIGKLQSETRVVSGSNITTTSVIVDYWRTSCSGACSTVVIVPSCEDLRTTGSDQATFLHDSICIAGKTSLAFVVACMAACIASVALVFVSLVSNLPIIYSCLVSTTGWLFSLVFLLVYGLEVIDKANPTALGFVGTTSSYWVAGYGYGMAIAASSLLIIASIILFSQRQSAYNDEIISTKVPPPGSQFGLSPLVSSPTTMNMGFAPAAATAVGGGGMFMSPMMTNRSGVYGMQSGSPRLVSPAASNDWQFSARQAAANQLRILS